MARYYNTSLKNLEYRLRKFKPVLEQALKEEIVKNSDYITDAIQMQLEAGLDGFLDRIEPPYAPRTIKRKIKKGQPTDRVTLKDTGKFYSSLRLESDEIGFRVVSNDEKVKYLVDRYGQAILRLSNYELKNLLRDYIRPALVERMKTYLQNGGA